MSNMPSSKEQVETLSAAFSCFLNQISTQWSIVSAAHDGAGADRDKALKELLVRYGEAVRRYLRKALRDPDVADDLFQVFALRLIQGQFHRASPERGRFRDYVQQTLKNLVVDHFRRERRRPGSLPAEGPELAVVDSPSDQYEQEFHRGWREELLALAWSRLEEVERQTGKKFYTVLHLRAAHPDWSSAQMAEHLTATQGKPWTAVGVRQTLLRARKRFVDQLIRLAAATLEVPTVGCVKEELQKLGLPLR